jgi:choline dehydrogenase-like flavoprotein
MAGDQADHVEFWHDAVTESQDMDYAQELHIPKLKAGWLRKKPPAEMIRVPGIVHETSTLYMSDDLETDLHASVDRDYRPHGCDNVYVTGGALFPTSGSWNRECCATNPRRRH